MLEKTEDLELKNPGGSLKKSSCNSDIRGSDFNGGTDRNGDL